MRKSASFPGNDRVLNRSCYGPAGTFGWLIYRPAPILTGAANLVSGRFAMIDNGLGFQLVPWQPLLERHIGRYIDGLQRDGRIEWTLGRNRGLNL